MTISELPKFNPSDLLGKTGGTKSLKDPQTITDSAHKPSEVSTRVATTTHERPSPEVIGSNEVNADLAGAKATKDLSPMERQKDYPTFLDPDKIAAFDGIWAAMRQSIQSGQKMA